MKIYLTVLFAVCLSFVSCSDDSNLVSAEKKTQSAAGDLDLKATIDVRLFPGRFVLLEAPSGVHVSDGKGSGTIFVGGIPISSDNEDGEIVIDGIRLKEEIASLKQEIAKLKEELKNR
jgi:hypothetical protein